MSSVLSSAIAQGLLWSILAIGIYVTYRLLNISDLTSEGSFTLGAAVTAFSIVAGVPPILAVLLAALCGALAGTVTGLLHTKMHIPSLLAGILSMTGLYSVNLRVMGKANIPLNQVDTILSNLKDLLHLARDRGAAIPLGILAVALVIGLLVWFFNTEFGYAIVACGNNDHMIIANGVSSDKLKIAGFAIANALIALSGSLVCQYNGYADVQMGIGAIVVGLASVIIGEVFAKDKSFVFVLLSIVLGSVIYRLIVAFVINTSIVSANDMKLFTAVLVALAIWFTDLSQRKGGKKHA
ncbi:MAG: ABC transporter permease [Erysipelotrichaceae bacterium]|nr:ABC transporter permease [Erysipelotrichaceae bacterium]